MGRKRVLIESVFQGGRPGLSVALLPSLCNMMACSFDFPIPLWNVLSFPARSPGSSSAVASQLSNFSKTRSEISLLQQNVLQAVLGIWFRCRWSTQLGVSKALELISFTLRSISRRIMLLKSYLCLCRKVGPWFSM